jgi:hypothetical protein
MGVGGIPKLYTSIAEASETDKRPVHNAVPMTR